MELIFKAKQQAGKYRAEIFLPKAELKGQSFQRIGLSAVVPFETESLQGGRVIQRVGDWHLIELDQAYDGAVSQTLSFVGDGEIRKQTDYPYGTYLENDNLRIDVPVTRSVFYDSQERVPFNFKAPRFVPEPQMTLLQSTVEAPKNIVARQGAWNTAWLVRLLGRLGYTECVSQSEIGWPMVATQNSSLDDDFLLELTEEGASLQYRTQSGFFCGQAYTFQFVLQWLLAGQMKAVVLKGTPVFEYRGVHLDAVRHFFPLSNIEDWLDVIALFQFNHFHWHLTDDDGWRIESKIYPELNRQGAWRGPEELLPPQMGSGSARHGGFYRLAETKAFVQQLADMGMTVVPEMDLPGHARALLKSLPQLLEPNDKSSYRSVQYHSDNVINPAFGDTLSVISSLVEEWLPLFPGKLFHIGCDEVPEGVWQGSPAANAWRESTGRPITELNNHLTNHLEALLSAAGKTLAGWEEVADTGVSTKSWVYSWQGIDAGRQAAEAGYSVVMTPAQFCYFDLAVTDEESDPGYWWAGCVNLAKTYQYKPTQGLSTNAQPYIRGVQYCLWSELLDSPQKVEFMWFPRLLAGAQVVWGTNTNEDYSRFLMTAKQWVQVLIRLGVTVRSEKRQW